MKYTRQFRHPGTYQCIRFGFPKTDRFFFKCSHVLKSLLGCDVLTRCLLRLLLATDFFSKVNIFHLLLYIDFIFIFSLYVDFTG